MGGHGFGTRTFWTAAIPDSDVQVHFGAGSAELHVTNLALVDYRNIPTALGPQWQTAFDPATVSFDVVWSGPVTRRVRVAQGTNGNQFAGHYVENQATVTWSGTNHATGFTFTSDPGNFSTSVAGRAFAELGQEGNGSFFRPDDDTGGAFLAQALATRAVPEQYLAAPPVAVTPARGGTEVALWHGNGNGQPLATGHRNNGLAGDFTVRRPAAAHPPPVSAFEPIADPFAEAGPQGAAARFR